MNLREELREKFQERVIENCKHFHWFNVLTVHQRKHATQMIVDLMMSAFDEHKPTETLDGPKEDVNPPGYIEDGIEYCSVCHLPTDGDRDRHSWLCPGAF
jgi:hypothetical protein